MRHKDVIITEDDFKDARRPYDIKDLGDEFDQGWGYDTAVVTRDDIAALLDGKILSFDVCEEYSLFLKLEEET